MKLIIIYVVFNYFTNTWLCIIKLYYLLLKYIFEIYFRNNKINDNYKCQFELKYCTE